MVDLDELARRAVADAPTPTALAILEERARTRRRRRQLAGAIPLAALVGMISFGAAQLVRDDESVVTGLPEGTATSVPSGWEMRSADGVSVLVPPGWSFRAEDLTPVVSDPTVVWAAGTGPIPAYGGERCAHQPTAALDQLSPDGVLVVLFEARGAGSDFPLRATDLWSMRGVPNQDDAQECSSVELDSWWFAFADRGRAFHLLIATGRELDDGLGTVEAMVNSITVEAPFSTNATRAPDFDAGAAADAALSFFDALARADWPGAARQLESPGLSPVEFGADIELTPYATTEVGRLIRLEPALADARDLPGLLAAWCEQHGGLCGEPLGAAVVSSTEHRDYLVEVKLAAPNGDAPLSTLVRVGRYEGEWYVQDLPPLPSSGGSGRGARGGR